MAAQKTERFYQYFSTMTANLGFLHMGITLGWSSPMKIMLDNPELYNMPFNDKYSTAWIISMPLLAASLSAFVAGYLGDKFGRRNVMAATGLPTILSWLMEILIPNAMTLYICRFVQGFMIGITATIIPVYLGEITEPTIRGTLGSTMNIFLLVGQTLMFSFSWFKNYYVLQIPGLICGLLTLFITMTIPESPAYFVTIDMKDQAHQSLKILRGSNYDTTEEIRTLDEDSLRRKNEPSLKEILDIDANRVSLILGMALMFFRQFSGINIIVFYVEFIFHECAPDFPSVFICALVGLITTLVSIVSVSLFYVAGRKILFALSALGMFAAYAILGTTYVALTRDSSLFQRSAVFSIFLYLASYGIGWGSGPWILLGELFSLEVKKVASSAAIVVNFFCAFLTTIGFPILIQTVGNALAFYTLATACAFAGVFIIFAVPETKNKSLHQIQEELQTGKWT